MIVAVLFAVVVSACGKRSASPTAAALPDLTGTTMRDATRMLADLNLRWSYENDATVHTREIQPVPAGTALSPSEADDVVVDQQPTAGTAYDENTIVVLATRCTRLEESKAACA